MSGRGSTRPMRTRSCITTRPAPRFRWPTSLLPIWPSGRPTAKPEALQERPRMAVDERVPGWRVRERDRVSFALGRYPQPSSTTSTTGRFGTNRERESESGNLRDGAGFRARRKPTWAGSSVNSIASGVYDSPISAYTRYSKRAVPRAPSPPFDPPTMLALSRRRAVGFAPFAGSRPRSLELAVPRSRGDANVHRSDTVRR